MNSSAFCSGILLAAILCQACHEDSKKSADALAADYPEVALYNELVKRDAQFKAQTADTVAAETKGLLNEYQTDTIYRSLKIIYGNDDRHNVYEPQLPAAAIEDAGKVACLIHRDQLKKNADGTYTLIERAQRFGEMMGLCDDENFVNEPVIAFGSGFAVAPRLFVTAGHCIKAADLVNTLIVYGYSMKSRLNPNLTIKPADVYEPESIVGRAFEGTTDDYCVVRVKSSFPATRVAKVRTTGKIPDNEQVHVIGYPSGLPVKITLDAQVKNNGVANYFVINSDTYEGNSGSPVFNSSTHVVEGILVRGGGDFRYVRLSNCYGSVRCPQDIGECRGEDVSRTSQFIHLLNNN